MSKKTIKKAPPIKGNQRSKHIIGLKDLRENMEKYIKKVKKGEEFTVVRRSKPIFNISAPKYWFDEGEDPNGRWESFVDLSGEEMPLEDVLKAFKKIRAERSAKLK